MVKQYFNIFQEDGRGDQEIQFGASDLLKMFKADPKTCIGFTRNLLNYEVEKLE